MATILQSILTFFTENRHIILYLSIVVIIFSWLLHFLIKQLTILKRKRKKLLKNKEQINAVPADSPPRNPTQTAKKVGMQSIESQFTISKKIIIPALITIFLLLLFIPMLDKIPATIISLVIGIITVIMSMAIRPFVENILSGIALSYSKAVNLGDTVLIDNNYGTIEDIKPICTTVKLWDWRRLIIPNSQMINRQFINYSLFDRYIWAYVEFEIAYNEDIKKIETIAKECARASAYFKNYDEPKFWVMKTGSESITCWIAAWTDSAANAWNLKNDIRTELIKKFRKYNITSHCKIIKYRENNSKPHSNTGSRKKKKNN